MPTVVFNVSIATITPYVHIDPIFLDLMQHYCVITLAGEAVPTSSSYGHQHKSYSAVPPAVTYTGIRCRLRSLTADEQTMIGRESETIEDYYLYIPKRWMPETMKEHAAPARHQVRDITTLRGALIQPGPFDVRSVREIAGEEHHYLVLLRRAG